MTQQEVINSINSVKKGSFVRFSYKTELPVKAAYKREGYIVEKICEMTSRFGINYSNISSVIERRSDENYTPSERTNNYEWIIKDVLCHNTNTGKTYLCTYPTKLGTNTKSNFTVSGPDPEADIKELVIDSYWKKKASPETMRINIDNIISIGGMS